MPPLASKIALQRKRKLLEAQGAPANPSVPPTAQVQPHQIHGGSLEPLFVEPSSAPPVVKSVSSSATDSKAPTVPSSASLPPVPGKSKGKNREGSPSRRSHRSKASDSSEPSRRRPNRYTTIADIQGIPAEDFVIVRSAPSEPTELDADHITSTLEECFSNARRQYHLLRSLSAVKIKAGEVAGLAGERDGLKSELKAASVRISDLEDQLKEAGEKELTANVSHAAEMKKLSEQLEAVRLELTTAKGELDLANADREHVQKELDDMMARVGRDGELAIAAYKSTPQFEVDIEEAAGKFWDAGWDTAKQCMLQFDPSFDFNVLSQFIPEDQPEVPVENPVGGEVEMEVAVDGEDVAADMVEQVGADDA